MYGIMYLEYRHSVSIKDESSLKMKIPNTDIMTNPIDTEFESKR